MSFFLQASSMNRILAQKALIFGCAMAAGLVMLFYVSSEGKKKKLLDTTKTSNSDSCMSDHERNTYAQEMARTAAIARDQAHRQQNRSVAGGRRRKGCSTTKKAPRPPKPSSMSERKKPEKTRNDDEEDTEKQTEKTNRKSKKLPKSGTDIGEFEEKLPAKKNTNKATDKHDGNYDSAGCLPVFDDGIVEFRHLGHLPYADAAASILRRIAKEYMPIIRRRGYDIKSVSEMCCSGDGIDYKLGGHRQRVQAGQRINGVRQQDCGGYNRTIYKRRRKTVHTIHLRMRHPANHNILLDYETLRKTMAHELAHCVHHNHEPPFWDLMEEILREHSTLVNHGGHRPSDYYDDDSSHQPFGGFNIYGSNTGRI